MLRFGTLAVFVAVAAAADTTVLRGVVVVGVACGGCRLGFDLGEVRSTCAASAENENEPVDGDRDRLVIGMVVGSGRVGLNTSRCDAEWRLCNERLSCRR